MARPSFNTSIPSHCEVIFNDVSLGSSTVLDGKSALEDVVGTSRRRPPGGFIAPTYYYLKYRQLQRSEGQMRMSAKLDPSVNRIYIGCVGGIRFNCEDHFNSCIEEGDIGDLDIANKSLIKARLKLKSSDINLGVAFAERKQTANLLGSTATRLAKSFSHLKRGNLRKAMNELGISSKKREPRGSNVPNKWLELQYGWKPFLSDVYGAGRALEGRDKGDWRVTVKAKVSGETREYAVMRGSIFAGTTSAVVKNLSFTRIDCLPENEGTISLVSLGVTNPALIVWEKVPFSFIVDWAFPIGNWLDSLDAHLGYENFSGSTSVLTRAEWVDQGSNDSDSFWSYQNQYAGRKRVVVLERTPFTDIPLPSFPRIKDPASLGHMANGLALLAGAFGRK
jgi:hypothetical protein